MAAVKKLPAETAAVLERAVVSGRFPHGILLTGGSAELRRSAAQTLAAMLECTGDRPPCGKCRDCYKVFAAAHPDVDWIEASGKSATVRLDDVKLIRQTGALLPNEGRSRVYIIPDAGRLRPEGQNSLLKIMEEPPDYVYMILCAEVRSVLLPTVRSRVYEINLGAPAAAAVTSRTEKKINDVCVAVVSALTAEDAFSVAVALAPLDKDRENISLCADKMKHVLRDAMTGGDCLSGLQAQADALKAKFSLPQLYRMNQAAEYVIEASARNANANLLLYLFAAGLTEGF